MSANKLSSFIGVAIALILLGNLLIYPVNSVFSSSQQTGPVQQKKEQITIRTMLTDLGDPNRWNSLIQPALQELRNRYPNLDIKIVIDANNPYNITRQKLVNALSNQTPTPIDLISLDQIWLAEFAERGLLTNLTDRAQNWGRLSDWYESNIDGIIYNDSIFGIWAWTDVRGIWYWKDLLHQTGINPDSLKTWDGYIAAAKKINNTHNGKIIQSVHLSGVDTAVDMWYPYLWMLGGAIVESRPGHPT